MLELLDKRLVFDRKGRGRQDHDLGGPSAAGCAQGKRTIVCEFSSQENASRIFEHTEVGFQRGADGREPVVDIDYPDESMREYALSQLKVRAMRDLLFRSRIFGDLAAATPGLKELS